MQKFIALDRKIKVVFLILSFRQFCPGQTVLLLSNHRNWTVNSLVLYPTVAQLVAFAMENASIDASPVKTVFQNFFFG